MNKKRIVITGASGFLGRHVEALLTAHDCVLLHNSKSERTANSDHRLIVYSVDELISEFPTADIIIHLAAFIPYGKFNEPSADFEIVNVGLTKRLAAAYPGARWVFASSVSVYGNSSDNPITTRTSVHPESLYAQSKWKAEQFVAALSNAAIVRFSSITGKGMKPVSMIPLWLEQAQKESKIAVWGKGTRTQNYIDVRDAAGLLYLLAFSDWKGVVLGVSSREYTNGEVAKIIADAMPVEITHTPHEDERGVNYDDRATHERIGFIPKFELSETIRDMIAS